MKIGFLSFDAYHGKKDTGSTRIRVDWLLNHWKEGGVGEAEKYLFGQKYDVVVYQKAYWVEHAKAFQGKKILDLCDPDWFNWAHRFKEMIDLVDAVTCSGMEIAKFVTNLSDKPVYVIPDRIDLDLMPEPKKHAGEMKKCVWFGNAENFEVLDSVMPALMKKNLELIIISNAPYANASISDLQISNLSWAPHTWMSDIQRGDVVINFQPPKGRFRYKSDNKTTQAWALGLPVILEQEDLERFNTAEERNAEVKEKLEWVKKERDVRLSVKEMSDVINDIYA